MSRQRSRSREIYPGVGMVASVAIGLAADLLFWPDMFLLGTGIGAMAGLLGGDLLVLLTRTRQ